MHSYRFKMPQFLEVRWIDDILGFGVFTTEPISGGSLIETCHFLEMGDFHVANPTFDYAFYDEPRGRNLLPFGFACIYNHSFSPNIHWQISEDGRLMLFHALRDIAREEELVHNYGKVYWGMREKRLL